MRTSALLTTVAASWVALAPVGSASAQALQGRITAIQSGTVHLNYAARPGVCGNGRNITTRGSDEWEHSCDDGPVRLSIRLERGVVMEARTYVGGRWRPNVEATDLGTVSAPEAARALLALAERGDRGGDDLIFPAAIADSATVWPDLLRIARKQTLPRRTRRSAVFWLSQSASEAATKGLAELVGDEAQDREVREHAVFGLSQLDDGQGVPILLRVARSDRDPEIRRKAIFWLGQSDDPRAIAFFEEVLAGGGL